MAWREQPEFWSQLLALYWSDYQPHVPRKRECFGLAVGQALNVYKYKNK